MTEYEKKRAGRRLAEFIPLFFSSKSDFAQIVGVRPCTVTHWLTGRSPMPRHSIDKILTIISIEDVPVKIFRPDIFK